MTYFGLVRIPTRALFATTTVLIALLAAGMAAQAAAFLERANWLTAMDNVVWDSAWLLSDSSIVGKALHTLIGYTDQPTAMQLTVYLAILLATFVLMRLMVRRPRRCPLRRGAEDPVPALPTKISKTTPCTVSGRSSACGWDRDNKHFAGR